jgi:small subunit ribosomal protein S3
MGQKVHPLGFRLGITKNSYAKWFAEKKQYGEFLIEDIKLREFLSKKLAHAALSRVEIERFSNRIKVTVYPEKPGLVIGRKGSEIENLKKELSEKFKKQIDVDVVEIEHEGLDAQLVADSIARRIEQRVPFRRAMKRAVALVMESGAQGIKICCGGRLAGAEIARKEWYREGKNPLHTLKADIDFARATAHTIYGTVGVKVWIYKGEIEPPSQSSSSEASESEKK